MERQSIWQRIGQWLEAMDAAFDPSGDEARRLQVLEERVARLESEGRGVPPAR